MNRKIFNTTIILSILLITASCHQNSDNTEQVDSQPNYIHITQSNFETEKMEIGNVSNQIFEETIECQGEIFSPPKGRALLNPVLSGKVVEIKCSNGEYVNKGQVLLTLSSTELIVIQQNYVKALARQTQLDAEYKRRQSLHKEGVGTEKELLAIETEYKSVQADYKSLQLQLQLLQLDLKKIEAGDLYLAFPIVAPINGYITNISVVLGQFIDTQSDAIEIINNNQFQIRLLVFEQDIKNIQKGNKIHFGLLSDSDLKFSGTIEAIGRTVNPKTKTIECIASIDKPSSMSNFNGSFVKAHIVTKTVNTRALPLQAVLKMGNHNYVFVVQKQEKEDIYLSRERINTGMISENYIEVLDSSFYAPVLIKGNFNLPVE